MEGMFWGVAAMVVKDALKQQYLKGRDYERNVRQVYRDVDNLSITVDHVKSNCQAEDMETGPHALFIKRAEKQLRDSYRLLKREYPRNPGLTRLMEYASKPGAEMHLLDIGKEANQTARGLGDLLSEIRFAKIGKSKEEPPPEPSAGKKSAPRLAGDSSTKALVLEEHAIADDSTSSCNTPSDPETLFDRNVVPPSSNLRRHHSTRVSSSTGGKPLSRRPTTTRKRSYSASDQKPKALVPSAQPRPLEAVLETSTGRDREHALDNLQYGLDRVMRACDEEHEGEAMEYMQHALAEVLRLQKRQGFAGSQVDEDLGDAVEDLDDAMSSLLGSRTERERKYAMRKLSYALEDVDAALCERQRLREKEWEQRQRRITSSSKSPVRQARTHGSVRREQDKREKSRRYSMY